MAAELKVSLAVGEGSEKGRLRMEITGPGCMGLALALPWPLALWLGRALYAPETWLALKPCTDEALTVVYGDDVERTVVVTCKGRRWFGAASVQAAVLDGKPAVRNTAAEIGRLIMGWAKRVEELENANRLVADQALMFNRGQARALTTDPKILREAVKEAQFDHELRKGAGGLSLLETLNGRVIYGPPTALQFAPGASQHEQTMARVRAGSISKHERDAMRKALDEQENRQP